MRGRHARPADHAGNARELQRRGIKIIAGADDLSRAQAGDHGTLYPTSFFARGVELFVLGHGGPSQRDAVARAFP